MTLISLSPSSSSALSSTGIFFIHLKWNDDEGDDDDDEGDSVCVVTLPVSGSSRHGGRVVPRQSISLPLTTNLDLLPHADVKFVFVYSLISLPLTRPFFIFMI